MYNEELISAKVAARNAGKILMKYYQSDKNEVKMKGVDNPVTIAELEEEVQNLNRIKNEKSFYCKNVNVE